VNPLTALGAALAAAHFGAPLAYYAAAKRWLGQPWRIRPDPAYAPTVTVAYDEPQCGGAGKAYIEAIPERD